MTIQFQNHVSGQCLKAYYASGWRVQAVTCDNIDTSQQWTWVGNQLQSDHTSTCLSVSSSSATSSLSLATCNAADTKQHWSYSNTVITSSYWSDYALTDSPSSSYVDLEYKGINWFQYWTDGTNTAPKSPNIISLTNHVSGQCLDPYYTSNAWRVKAVTCDDTDTSQKWFWFDKHLQSGSRGDCLSVSSASAASSLFLDTCNPTDTKQHWQYNNTVITSVYYSDHALTDSPSSSYVDLEYKGTNWFQYWTNGTNTAPKSPNIISLTNHVSGQCLDPYYTSNAWRVKAVTCDDTDTSQKWFWFDKHLQSGSRGDCLSVSSASAASSLFLDTCNPTDTKQHWQYNNTVITSVYYSDHALTDSPSSSYVDLEYKGTNWFQYWTNGTNTAPKSPYIVSVQNHATGECLYTYYYSSSYRVKTTTCDDTDLTQKWAWFGNHLQSMSNGLCLTVSSSSPTSSLVLINCNPVDTKQHWQLGINHVIISSEHYLGYCLMNNHNSAAYLDSCDNNNNFQKWNSADNTFTFSPTPNPTSTTEIPTTIPTANPTYTTISPTANPTIVTINPTTLTTHPTVNPTINPISNPTMYPTTLTTSPTTNPTINPSLNPTIQPTLNPTTNPIGSPTIDPTINPSLNPTTQPTLDPITTPTGDPTIHPTLNPITNPTTDPTINPTTNPLEDSVTEPVTSDLSINPTIDSDDANSANAIGISMISILVIGAMAFMHELG